MAWIWIVLALLYILSPYDLLPDFIPLRGWLDDLVVLMLIVRYVMRLRKAKQGERQKRPQQENDWHQKEDQKCESEAEDPYRVLGISPGAAKEEIQSAYRKLASQYHPDKVAHLGAEFQQLAEKRFKEIQQAYEKIRNP